MSYAHRRYLLMTLDPTHIGAGGYRIGRVDNSIVREPGSNLPKIPGTSLSGAIRSYAAYRYGEIRCAGQGQPNAEQNKKGHCGKAECPICYTFGFTVKREDDSERSYSGTVNIYDAHILLFPVTSMIGPLWISTKRRLAEFGFTSGENDPEPNENSGSESCVMTQARTEPINLGWLMLNVESGVTTINAPSGSNFATSKEWSSIQTRIALVPESLFGQLVNAGLEVRTSVSIDPATGAAESGALFTYEAIPRATFLAFDLVQDDYRARTEPWTAAKALELGWAMPHQVAESGLQYASALGIGGMSTRGFGRIGLVDSGWEVEQ